jgi:hypothetical protein
MTMLPDEPDQLEWMETMTGEVKTNGKLHIYGVDDHSEVLVLDCYVRLEQNGVRHGGASRAG